MIRAVVTGLGSYLPARQLSNHDLAKLVDTNDEWIRERTGIHSRHIVADGEQTSDMAMEAAKRALLAAGTSAAEIDAIIVATSTPDLTMPSTATITQRKLGNHGAMAFDVNAACSGFVYALSTARGLIESGQSSKTLVIGAETMSRIVDWNDRGTCILFGDGAGAVVLEAVDAKDAGQRGLRYCKMHADGAFNDLLATSGGVSASQTSGVLHMAGKEVFRHGVDKMSQCVVDAAAALNMSVAELDLLVPHQANVRMLQAVGTKLGLPPEKVIVALDRHGNTSAASIPLALDVAQSQGKLRQGQNIALTALGAGLTWGCCIIHW